MREFVPLRSWIVPPVHEEVSAPPEARVEATQIDIDPREIAPYDCAEVRRFRAALEDALTVSVRELLRDLACDVLGRELAFPCDVATIVRHAIERYGVEPLRLRVHPYDRERAHAAGYPVSEDNTLRSGDVVIEVRCGTIDARLGTRLERLLLAHEP